MRSEILNRVNMGGQEERGAWSARMRSQLPARLGLLLCLLLMPHPSYAQDELLPAETLPEGSPPLPSPRDRNGGLLMVSEALSQYPGLFERPLEDWIRAKKIVFRAVRGLDHIWKLNDAWEKASASSEVAYRLKSDSGIEKIESNQDAPLGLPFGNRNILNTESDAKAKANKILWNILFMQRMNEEYRYTFDMAWSGSQILRKRSETMLYQRSFPRLQAEQPFLSQWVFRFLAPQTMQNYSLLSWEFRDETPGKFWIFSPPIQRVRELLPANRSDGILGGSISADDLFLWSSDPRKFQSQVLGEKTLFVLFPSLKPYPLVAQAADALSPTMLEATPAGATAAAVTPTPSNALPPAATATPPSKSPTGNALSALAVSGLKERPLVGGPTAVVWNFDSKQFPQLSPWLPTSVTAVPRKVWQLELVPNDPFYVGGRELLYVDQEMMLPVMKLTFDRIGELQKTTLGGWGLAERKDRTVVFPFLAFQLSVEPGAAPVTTLSATSVRKFASKDSAALKSLRGLLQPEAYGKPREASSNKAGQTDKTAAEEHSAAID